MSPSRSSEKAHSSFLFLVVRPGAPFVASLLLVAMPGAPSSFLFSESGVSSDFLTLHLPRLRPYSIAYSGAVGILHAGCLKNKPSPKISPCRKVHHWNRLTSDPQSPSLESNQRASNYAGRRSSVGRHCFFHLLSFARLGKRLLTIPSSRLVSIPGTGGSRANVHVAAVDQRSPPVGI